MLLLLPPGCCAAVSSGGAFLVNRSFQMELVPQSSLYCSLAGGNGPTLLDGELLLYSPEELRSEVQGGTVGRVLASCETDAVQGCTQAPGRATYLMFDAISLDGQHVGAQHFDGRLAALGRVRLAYKQLEHTLGKGQGAAQPPMLLMSKTFMPSAKVDTVFRHVKSLALADGQTRKVYDEGARCNLNDGVVFTPMQATYTDWMQSGVAPPLLKWKSAEDSTVDFGVEVAELRGVLRDAAGGSGPVCVSLMLSLGGSTPPVKVSEMTCSIAEARAMLGTAEEGGLTACVVECALGVDGWRVLRHRPGKARGNHVYVGWHTMQILAMPVSQRALCDALRQPSRSAPAPAPAAAAGGTS